MCIFLNRLISYDYFIIIIFYSEDNKSKKKIIQHQLFRFFLLQFLLHNHKDVTYKKIFEFTTILLLHIIIFLFYVIIYKCAMTKIQKSQFCVSRGVKQPEEFVATASLNIISTPFRNIAR